MAEKQKKRRRWFAQYLATLAKEGEERIAISACGVHPNQIAAACRNVPGFAKRREEALATGVKAKAARVPGRKPGRPHEIGEPQWALILESYAESGSSELAAALAGVSLSTVKSHRKRDSRFNADWLGARSRAAFFAGELGAWHEREARFTLALVDGVAWRDAALACGISEALGARLAARHGLSAAHARRLARPPNRFEAIPRRASHVRADSTVRRKASRAEVLGLSPELIEGERRLTPEQRALIDLFADDSMTLESACARMGLTLSQVESWAEVNAYLRNALP